MKPAILFRVVLLLICFGGSLSGRMLADGFLLPLHNAGTWGEPPAKLIADIQRALERSKFLDAVKVAGDVANEIGKGKVPAIDDLTGVIEGDVERRVEEAVAQATDATQLLAMLDVTALQQLFTTLQTTVTTPLEFAFSIPGGRLVFRRNLVDVSLCAVIAGPGGARVTLGMSGGQQLAGNPAPRFLNPTREPMLFADFAMGLAHVQARRKLLAPPVPGADPALSVQAAIYFKIHDDWVELRLAGNDPQSLSLKLQFVVGVKAGFSVKLQAEVEGQIVLELEVKPTQVASLLQDIGDILKRRLGTLSPSSAGAAPALAASVFQEVFTYLRTVEDRGEELGELSIRFAGDGGVGLGIWDTGINAASVGAELTLSVPLEAIVSLEGDVLATQFGAGLEISTQLVSFFEAMSEGRLTEAELQRQLVLVGGAAEGFARSMLGSYADYLQDVGLHYEMGVYVLGDIGQVADQTIPLIIVGADVPVGKILVDGVNGIPRFVQGVTESAKAVVWTAQLAISAGLESVDRLSLGNIVKPPVNPGGYVQRPRGNPPTPPTPAQWEAMAAHLLDDVSFSIQMGVVGVEGASLGNLVRLAGGANEVTTGLLVGAVRSALEANEKPLLEALRATPGQIGNEARDLLFFNLQNLSIGIQGSLGASGTVGAEATAGIGASIGFEARIKTSLILLALGNDAYDEEDGTLLAGIDFPLEVSASAGVSVGEGVEVSAEGGVSAGASLANLTLKDWGRDLPAPAGLSVAGFEVIDVAAVQRQDGSLEGSGWIVLPMGGLVRADRFSLDGDGRVLDGRWNGVLELGPFGEVSVASGRISSNGLLGSGDLVFGLNRLNANLLLRGNGLLFGNTVGRLSFAGLDLVADLRLDESGFLGSGKTTILGSEFNSTNLRILPNGSIAGTFSGTLAVDGQVLSLQALEIRGNTLQGRTTLNLAGHPAVELLLTIDDNGIIGTFVGDLDLFGAGTSSAWVRITDKIEVFGSMDGDFLGLLESLMRAKIVAGVADAQEALRRERDKLAGYRADVDELNRTLVALEAQIQEEQRMARAAAEAALRDAEAALRQANAELDQATAAVIAASGQLAEQLANASTVFRAASSALSVAQGEVDKINRDIANLDRWYNSLDPIGKAFFWVGYQGSRATLLAVREGAMRTLAVAQQAFNAADSTLKAIQQQLAQAEALLAIKALKEQLVAAAEAKAAEARATLEAIIGTIADPKLDPRYIAVSLARDSALGLIRTAETLIAQTLGVLGDVAGLIELIEQNGGASLVKIDKVQFRSRLAELNGGSAELIVDARVANQPRRFVMPYDLNSGQNQENIATAARWLSPQLYPETAWKVSPWTDDASSGLTSRTVWAYHFNATGIARIGSVVVQGLPGTTPTVSGRFSVQGFTAAYTGDQNVLTSGTGGSSIIAAHFLYGANPGHITVQGLTPGTRYRVTLLSVGWDEAPITRSIDFNSGTDRLAVSQNGYGNNRGIRIDHIFTADANTHAITLTPAAPETFHLYALALSVEDNAPMTFTDWNQAEFGAGSFNPGIAAEDADPDGDDIPNLLEYALRSNPQVKNPSAFALPVPITLPDSGEARQFSIPFQATSGDLVYRIRHSTDLVTWTEVYSHDLSTGTTSQIPGVSSDADATTQTLTVTIRDLRLLAPPSYWRLSTEKR